MDIVEREPPYEKELQRDDASQCWRVVVYGPIAYGIAYLAIFAIPLGFLVATVVYIPGPLPFMLALLAVGILFLIPPLLWAISRLRRTTVSIPFDSDEPITAWQTEFLLGWTRRLDPDSPAITISRVLRSGDSRLRQEYHAVVLWISGKHQCILQIHKDHEQATEYLERWSEPLLRYYRDRQSEIVSSGVGP